MINFFNFINFKDNKYYFLGLLLLLIIFIVIDQILNVVFWGDIKKVLLFENSITSRKLILNFLFPLISFNQNLGFPILAESQVGALEPIKQILNIIFGSLNHINLTFFFRVLVLYTSVFILLKDAYKLTNSTSLIASLFVVLSPIIWNDVIHQFHLGSYYLLPLSIYFIDKFLDKKKYLKYFTFGSLIVFLQLMAGHFNYQLICILILSLYTTATILLTKDTLKIIIFKIAIFSLTIFFGFLLASVQILPTYELMLDGNRSDFTATYQGSLSISGIALFYKSLSKLFNNVDGSLGTLGYMVVFIYTINQFINSLKIKKILYNRIYFRYVIIFFIIYLFSLGEYFSYNDIIYKLIPFLESFRVPSRFMLINSFCTVMLFAIAFDELKKDNFKIENLNISFLLLTVVFLIVYLWFSKYITTRKDLDLSYWLDSLFIFYPFILILGTYLILKKDFIKKNLFFFFIIFFFLLVI